MAGLNDTDIRLDATWQLTQAATGDAPTASGFDCTMQDIKLEAVSQAGELFYDEDWGWSLVDFVHSEDDELTIIEIKERIKEKLEKRDIIKPDSIVINIDFSEDILSVLATFQFANSDQNYSLNVSVDRINVEVVTSD